MKLISWNVNGLRACLGKGFQAYFAGVGNAFTSIVSLLVCADVFAQEEEGVPAAEPAENAAPAAIPEPAAEVPPAPVAPGADDPAALGWSRRAPLRTAHIG